MRAALATAELDDADLRQIYEELTSIKTTALDPAGKLAMAITRSQTETRLASHAAVKALFALAPAADATDSASLTPHSLTPRRPTSGFEETVIMPDQLSPTQRAAWTEAAGGADNTTLTAIAAEVMRATMSAAKVADAAGGQSPRDLDDDDDHPVRRTLEEEMRSPAYESIMLAAQNVVYDTQVEEREVLLAAIGAVITNVSCRVLQAIEPSIQSMTIKHGDQTSNSFTALLGETQKTFERYTHEMMNVSDQASLMQGTYERQIALNQTLTGEFSSIMSKISTASMEKYQYGEDDAGVERKPGWGIKSDAQVRLAMEGLDKLNVQKLTVRNDMTETSADIKAQKECLDTFATTVVGIMSKFSDAGSIDSNEKSINIGNPTSFAGEFTSEMMEKSDSPVAAKLMAAMVTNICLSYPKSTGAAHPWIKRIFAESRAGKSKSVPPSLLAESRTPGVLAESGMSPAYQKAYKKANNSLYTFLSKKFEKALTDTHRPYKIVGSDESGIVQSTEGDAVMSLFIIIDKMEKYGWEDRNAKREFYACCDILIGSEPSMKRGMELLRLPIVEAQRLDTVMEFDVFKRFCMTVLRRENAVLGPTVRKYMEVDRNPDSAGYEENCLGMFDELLAEISTLLDEYDIDKCDTVTSGVNHAEALAKAETFAAIVLESGWKKTNAGGTTGDKAGGKTTTTGQRGRGGEWKAYKAPEAYANKIPICANLKCKNPVSTVGSQQWVTLIRYLVAKNLSADSPDHLACCLDCYNKLMNGEVQAHAVSQGRLIKVQNPTNRGRPWVARLAPTGAASVNAAEAEPMSSAIVAAGQSAMPPPGPTSSFSGFGNSSVEDYLFQASVEENAKIFAAVEKVRARLDQM